MNTSQGTTEMDSSVAAAASFEPGSWVLRRDWQQLAKVKEFNPASSDWEATLDLVVYARDGEKRGRVSPAMGGPRGFEPCCSASEWVRIHKPLFPLDRYSPLHRLVQFVDKADQPQDDGRL